MASGRQLFRRVACPRPERTDCLLFNRECESVFCLRNLHGMHRIGAYRDKVNPPASKLVRRHKTKFRGFGCSICLKLGCNSNGPRLDTLNIRRATTVLENGERRDRDSANAHTLAQARRHEFRRISAVGWCRRRCSAACQAGNQYAWQHPLRNQMPHIRIH